MQLVEWTDATNLAHLFHGRCDGSNGRDTWGLVLKIFENYSNWRDVFKEVSKTFRLWGINKKNACSFHWRSFIYIGTQIRVTSFDKNSRCGSARPLWSIGRCWLREPYPQIWNKSFPVIQAINFIKSHVIAVLVEFYQIPCYCCACWILSNPILLLYLLNSRSGRKAWNCIDFRHDPSRCDI